MRPAPTTPIPGTLWRGSLLVWAAATVVALLSGFRLLVTYRARGVVIPVWDALVTSLVDWYLWALLVPLVIAMARRFPLQRDGLLGRLALHGLAAVAVTWVQAMGFGLLTVLMRGLQRGQESVWDQVAQSFVFKLGGGVLVYCALALGWQAITAHRARVREALRSSRLEARLTAARLEVLQAWLQPHFLHNTLSAIAELVHEEPRTVDRMITRLGALLRAARPRGRVELIPLGEEIQLLDAFLDIHRVRFGDRLRFELDAGDDTLDAAVPPLLLQPLAENAVRHGLLGGDALTLGLRAVRSGDGLEIEVWDDGAGVREPAPAHGSDAQPGFGLAGTRERLELLFDPVRFQVLPRLPRGTSIRIRIPFRIARAPGIEEAV